MRHPVYTATYLLLSLVETELLLDRVQSFFELLALHSFLGVVILMLLVLSLGGNSIRNSLA